MTDSVPSPAVGVVMTAFNSEAFIEAALASLVGQSYTDWHCVVVDDGSTDSTVGIVTGLAAREPRIRLVVRPARGGVSEARNTGLRELADGVRHVSFLDSDDLYLPNALEDLVAALEERPDAVGAYGLAEYIDESGTPSRAGEHSAMQLDRRAVRDGRMVTLPPEADSGFADISIIGSIWPSAVGLHRRSVLDEVGHFDTSFTRQGDWELYVRMSRQGAYILVNRQVAWYRRHGSNLTGNVMESCFQQERVRYKAWTATANTVEHRRVLASGTRRLRLSDLRKLVRAGFRDVAERRPRALLVHAGGAVMLAATLVRPGPPRPSRLRVRLTQPDGLRRANA